MLEKVRIILVNPSHPGNIGAVARAMKNMGLSRLYLVAPESFPDPQAYYRAAGADDVLDQAIITQGLSEALKGCEYIYATSTRLRHLEWPSCNARECAQNIMSQPIQAETAIIFGRESSGLTNEELAHCQQRVYIPANENFSSLNLAAAVQVVGYELLMAYLSYQTKTASPEDRRLAAHEELEGLYEHWRSTLIKLECLDPTHPRQLMQRIQRIFSRAQLDSTEINILRGVLTAMNKKL